MKKKLLWKCSYCGKDHNWIQDPCAQMLDFWNEPRQPDGLSLNQLAKKAVRRMKRRKNTPLAVKRWASRLAKDVGGLTD
jgi:hypothetical protein